MTSRNKWRILSLGLPLLLFALLWHKAAQRPRLLPGLGGTVTSLAFSPDGKTLVCATSNAYLQKWVPEISKWRSFQRVNGYMTNLPPLFARPRFDPDGQTLYGGG